MGGILAVVLFAGVGPGAGTDGVVEPAVSPSFKGEVIHTPRPPDGSSTSTFFCMPEDQALVVAVLKLHNRHGHIATYRALPRFDRP